MNRSSAHARTQAGITLVELLLAMVLAIILLASLAGVSGQILQTRNAVTDRNELNREARLAMEHITRAAGRSTHLMLPYHDKTWSVGITENIRDVLAVTQDHTTDLDYNGIPDADNDGDGRIDEDPPADQTNDAAHGIYLVDDDGDGTVDEGTSPYTSDDESTTKNDDPVNGVDDDNDQNIDEDPPADRNDDGCSGICGVDDDGDGSVDESTTGDDDEDGSANEDWLDPVVFRLSGTQLLMRTPVPWDVDGDSDIDGRDFIESVIADNVSQFRVERLPDRPGGQAMLDVTLALTRAVTGETVSVNARLRVGGAL